MIEKTIKQGDIFMALAMLTVKDKGLAKIFEESEPTEILVAAIIGDIEELIFGKPIDMDVLKQRMEEVK